MILREKSLMAYRYLDNIAMSDVAFEARGRTLEEMFVAASDALMNVMVRDLDSIRMRESRRFQIQDSEIDLLLVLVLQEFIFYKDSESLLLRCAGIRLKRRGRTWTAAVESKGEAMDPHRHDLLVDVKAVTLHRLQVTEIAGGWNAVAVLDV